MFYFEPQQRQAKYAQHSDNNRNRETQKNRFRVAEMPSEFLNIRVHCIKEYKTSYYIPRLQLRPCSPDDYGLSTMATNQQYEYRRSV
jgi:hypothetical protein